MRNSKKIAAFLMALVVTSMNVPMTFDSAIQMVAHATEASNEGIIVTTQPKNAYGDIGDIVLFSVTATGVSKYQWQYNSGNGWVNWNGGTNSTLSVTINNRLKKTYTYRCAMTDAYGEVTYTDEVNILDKLERPGIGITSQPVTAYGDIGDTVSFSVTATGVSKYQWQYNSGNGWVNWNGGTNSTLSVTINNRLKKTYTYRCAMTDAYGEVTYTDEVRIVDKLTLTDPESTTITSDTDATFAVTATGTGDLTYMWEFSTDGEVWDGYNGDDANTTSITISGSDAVNGTQYRCVVSDNYGQSKTSNAATLTVETPAVDNHCGPDMTYDYADGVLTISGTGFMDYEITSNPVSPFAAILEENNVTSPIDVVVENGVEGIGAYAFTDIAINNITLPESVRIIGKGAFNNTGDTTLTVEYPALMFSNDSGLDAGDNMIGYSGSSAENFANANDLSFTAINDDFDDTDHDIYLNVGESTTINATGTRLRYVSSNYDVADVDQYGNVTAVNDGYAMIFVYDVRGRSQAYDIHVGEGRLELPLYQIICPGDSFTIGSDVYFHVIRSDESAFSLSDYWDDIYNMNFTSFKGATEEILSYTDNGQTAITYANAIVDVIPAKNGVTYSGRVEKDGAATGGVWYALTAGDTDVRVDLSFASGTELAANIYQSYSNRDYYDEEAEAWCGSQIWWGSGYNFSDTITVPAGKTYYLCIMPINEDGSGDYSFTATYTNYEHPVLTDNEEYTLVPSMQGEMTTISFTAPAEGNYLIETIGSKFYHYDIANNAEMQNNDDEGQTCYGMSADEYGWGNTSCYYAWLSEGETAYIRAWFDEETEESDNIKFRIHAVSAADEAVVINDFENPNVLSKTPDDFDRRTFDGEAGKTYYIYVEGNDTHTLIWDQNWLDTGVWNVYDGYSVAEFTCNEAQTYHFMVLPRTQTDRSGNVNVWISTYERVPVSLDETCSVYDMRLDHRDFIYTAEEDGTYYISIDSIKDISDDVDQTDDESNNIVLWLTIHDTEDIDNESAVNGWSFPYRNTEDFKEATMFDVTAGQVVMINFDHTMTSHLEFSLHKTKPYKISAELDNVYANVAKRLENQEYAFTAPEDGTYLFTAAKDDTITAPSGDFSFELYDTDRNAIDGSFICTDSYVNYTYSLTAGETVYVKILPQYAGETTYYRFVVRNTDQPMNTEMLTDAAGWKTNDMTAEDIQEPAVFELSDVTANSFTINVANHGTEDWYTQVFYELPLIEGNPYLLQFNLTADNDSAVSLALQRSHLNYDTWGWQEVTASDAPYSFLIEADTDGLAKLFFQNFQPGTYTISDISLVPLSEEAYQAYLDAQDQAEYPYNHENYMGTVTSDNPVWISYTTENASLFDIYELINIYGDVNVEVYEADQETLYPSVYAQCDNHRRVYFEDDMTIWFKVSTENESEDYKFHFAKFDREDTVVLEEDVSGTIEPYSVEWYAFTAAETGNYTFNLNADGQFNMELYLNNRTTGYLPEQNEYNSEQNGFSGYWQFDYETSMHLDAGDTVYIKLTDNQYDVSNGYTLSVQNSEENIEDGGTDG